jgi:arylsulfatase A
MGDRVVIGGKGTTTDAGMHVPLIASWPGKAAAGAVCSDLVDSTDFLSTICDAAGIEPPGEMTIDGRNFLPQIRGEKGKPREWIYSWYSPRGEALREFAFTANYKLYTSGEFYDLQNDSGEMQPQKAGELTGDAAAAARLLQAALDEYKDARPDSLRQPSGQETPKAKNRAKKKRKVQ